MKLWERVVEARLRKVVEICEQQYGFMPRKSTTDAIFALRILMEKYRDGQRELHCVFVDLEKAYDRVPREELWYCMRKSGVAEKYVRVVQDMYERNRTVVRCAVGQTEEFKVEVGLHQGSALSPFLFAVVMDQLSEEVRQESPWTMMFADDIVICSESREQVEENLERWRFALERRGMKVSRSKTEYMCVNEREGSGTVRLQGEEVKKAQEFKYLGSTVQSNGECGKEVKKRVQAGWNGWRKVSGVLCERKISARIKGKVYRTVVRPAMLYGLETVSLRKRQESELEVAELKMLRFSLGVTRLDRIRNEYIRGTAHVGRLGDKVREARLRWFGHVQRREMTEFRMPVPWGEMRGRVWGPEHGRPVLCLHGWSDNSGSFNTLIPLLPADWRCVAVDLPGHGFSSHRPAGVFYSFPSYIADVQRVIEALQWKRFSIIGHSMGGNLGGMLCALYPDMVEALVLLDSYGFLPVDVKRMSRIMYRGIQEMLEYEKKLPDRKERIYTYEKAKERLKAANPFLSDKSVEILLERGLQEVEGGVVFTRDIRINLTNIIRNTLEQCLEMQSQITSRVLVLRASQGLQKTFPQPEEIAVPLLNGWSGERNTIMTVEGDHHVHLNNPELVAPIITDFLLSQTSQQTANASGLNQSPKL
ncbi:hypothetical protein QTP70_032093 [Hemibagrus guttatus]|uniref:ribonuclease H n=1 Tax=Hemibagrus guttatus TaxID=175788 RepID=A0AAE0ULX9_9TELE|nr:hypothetical protein QTP70_032093 [Hemibagrus guttatus]KAK3530228.1 hypothetical protein QTP86_020147 [Hemibagrus guttatus]